MSKPSHAFPKRAIVPFLWKNALAVAILSAHLDLLVRGAETSAPLPTRNLGDLSIEELMNESVTSVSKKETKLNQSPAAITVITQEEIRRSGLTSLPELLRVVPGLDVARINGNEWAISSRGFNAQFANKLLVMIDGRTVYTPASSGVFWDAQDVVLEDLDRIEVIRGPGSTLWGANAVNGVINITTKSAKDTQGTLISASGGTEDQPSSLIRYGGQLSKDLYYRVYVKYFNRDGMVDPSGAETADDWNTIRGGFRMDWEPTVENKLTLQGDYYRGEAGQNLNQTSLTPPFARSVYLDTHIDGANVVGRWTRTFSESSELSLQTYYDHVRQDNGLGGTEYRDTYDIELQHRFQLGARNDIVAGAGYRFMDERISPSFFISFFPDKRELQLFNVFVQDDITLVEDRLHFTLGSKFEHNDLTGLELQPSARLSWTPTERQTLWAAASRATRTPSLIQDGGRLNFTTLPPAPGTPPAVASFFGNPNIEVETVTAYELGYRIEPAKRLSFDVAGFYNVYDNVVGLSASPRRIETSPAPPHVIIPSTFQNSLAGESYGTEFSTLWQVTDNWRLIGSYTWLNMRVRPDPSIESDSPQQQFQIRSYVNLPHDIELNGALYYVDEVSPQSGVTRVPIASYFRLDLGIVWRPTKGLEIGVWGQNLLDNQHPEYRALASLVQTEIPRGVLGKITWRF
jgi:iron complex outermembrane receptor protein